MRCSHAQKPLPTLEQITQLPRTHRSTIPVDYMDDMGHMNVMWYTFLYSRAIRRLLEPVGLTRDYTQSQQAGTFALEKHLRYLAEVRVGEQVSVYSRLVSRHGSRFHLVQFMVNDSQQRVASIMETVSTHVDLVERRSVAMPPAIQEAFDSLLAKHLSIEWSPPLCGAMSSGGRV